MSNMLAIAFMVHRCKLYFAVTKACNQYGVIRSTFCTVDHTTAFADLLNASAVVEEIVVDVSQCTNIPDPARLSVYFQDASDTQSPVLTYVQVCMHSERSCNINYKCEHRYHFGHFYFNKSKQGK